MDLRKLKTLIDLVSESNVSELEITEAEGKVRIVKSAGVVQQFVAAAPVAAAPAAAPAAPVAELPPPCGRGRPPSEIAHGGHVLPRIGPGCQAVY